MMEFHVVLEEDPETGRFLATVTALPEIVVDAKNEEEALRLVQEAIVFALDERAREGLPKPRRSRPPRSKVVTVEV